MQRRVSLTASGSSLNVDVKESRDDKLEGDARYSEPAGALPRVLIASRAWEAS